jgi:alkylhydroperoxidase/carboxymuconolactone decarboxylase family protein YurZ
MSKKKDAREPKAPKASKPPKRHRVFVERYPDLAKAWELIAQASAQGPLDPKVARLVKLGIAMGAMGEGAVRASVRKATDLGITLEELEQVVALAAGTVELPSAVALHSWLRDELDQS